MMKSKSSRTHDRGGLILGIFVQGEEVGWETGSQLILFHIKQANIVCGQRSLLHQLPPYKISFPPSSKGDGLVFQFFFTKI